MLGIIASYHCMQFQGKLMIPTQENGKILILAYWAWTQAKTYFKKICLLQSLNIMVSYHHVQYQKKLMIQSWGNVVTDGWMEGQTGRQTDESDFIGYYQTNIEHPIKTCKKNRSSQLMAVLQINFSWVFPDVLFSSIFSWVQATKSISFSLIM